MAGEKEQKSSLESLAEMFGQLLALAAAGMSEMRMFESSSGCSSLTHGQCCKFPLCNSDNVLLSGFRCLLQPFSHQYFPGMDGFQGFKELYCIYFYIYMCIYIYIGKTMTVGLSVSLLYRCHFFSFCHIKSHVLGSNLPDRLFWK